MKPVLIRRSANADIDEIFAWIAPDNPDAAERLVQRVFKAMKRLADFPDSGTPRPALGQGARSLVVGDYLVLYRVGPDTVDIVRIVHGARDLAALLGEGEEDEESLRKE